MNNNNVVNNNVKTVSLFPVYGVNKALYELKVPYELKRVVKKRDRDFLQRVQNNFRGFTTQEWSAFMLGLRAYDAKCLKKMARSEEYHMGFPLKELGYMNTQLFEKYSPNRKNKKYYNKVRTWVAEQMVNNDQFSYWDGHAKMCAYFFKPLYEVNGKQFSFYQLYATTMKWHDAFTQTYKPVLDQCEEITYEDQQIIEKNIFVHAQKHTIGYACEWASKLFIEEIAGKDAEFADAESDQNRNIDFFLGSLGFSVKSGMSLASKQVKSFYSKGEQDYTVGFSSVKISDSAYPGVKIDVINKKVQIKELIFSDFVIMDADNDIISLEDLKFIIKD